MEKISYGGWQNCYRLSNGAIELVVTTDVGPRIIRCALVGESNVFNEYADQLGKTGGDVWRIYGGHRLWHAPEAIPRSYYPDNGRVYIEPYGRGVRLVAPAEADTWMQKEIDIELDASAAAATITHRIYNRGVWAVETAAWALSVTAPGSRAIIPLPPKGTHAEHLEPGNTLTLWKYTDMSDVRWTWGRKYIMLQQKSQAAQPQKVGASVPDGWAAAARDGLLFVKKFTYAPGAAYPDGGCSVETYTDGDMLELETLGPLVHLAPGAFVQHVERWFLFRDVPVPQNDDDVDAHVLPKVQQAG